MDLRFEDLSGFFSKPPGLSQLLGKALDSRRKGGSRRLLFIVPSYRDNTRLRLLLRDLAKQTMLDFDVAIIYGQNDTFVRVPGVSALHVRRKMDVGFAGAVYIGQLIAIRDKYEYFLATDVDKHPASNDSLKLLLRTADLQKADCVYGKPSIVGDYIGFCNKYVKYDKPVLQEPRWVLWELIRTARTKIAGLILLPLYFGAEEVEYGIRLFKSGGRHVYIDKPVFRTYDAKHEGRFFNLLKNGGRDYTMTYTSALSLYNFPEAHFKGFTEYVAKNPVKKIMLAIRLLRIFFCNRFFVAHLMAARAPEFSAYVENAKKMRFGIFDWPEKNEHVKIAKVAPDMISADLLVRSKYLPMPKAPKMPNSDVSSTLSINALFIKNMLFRYTPLFSASELSLFWLFLFDTLFVYDEKSRAYYKVQWKRKFSRLDLLLIWARLEFECATCFAKVMLGMPKGKIGAYGAKAAD